MAIVVVEDRYCGTYSGGEWLAIDLGDGFAQQRERLAWIADSGPHGCDTEAAEFWGSEPDWICAGKTLDEAINCLAALWSQPRPVT